VSVQFVPQSRERGAAQILKPLHRRRGFRQRNPIVLVGFRDAQIGGAFQVRIMAKGREIAPGQPAPKPKRRRQRLVQQRRGEQLEPVRARRGERFGELRRCARAELRLRLVVRLDKQMSAGR
jgi:hypothetical protein